MTIEPKSVGNDSGGRASQHDEMGDTLTLYDEDAAARVAGIFGPYSAAALALDELSRRRALGEDARLFKGRFGFVVGPLPQSNDPGAGGS